MTRAIHTQPVAEALAPAVRIDELHETARRVRIEVVQAVARAGGGHVGASLSAADILVGLYFAEMNIRPDAPDWTGRDRFVLSKGHAALALYATLALRGYFAVDELVTFGHLDSRFQGHPDMTRLTSVDISTGALGAGFSAAVGMAMGSKLRGTPERTYVLLGDGECQEGEVWEAAFVAGRYRLDNLLAIVDLNGYQVTGWPGTEPGSQTPPWPAEALARQWAASGWTVLEVDGHDIAAILAVLATAREMTGRPVVVIARTIKGKGVSFMKGWHSRPVTPDELDRAMEELREAQ